MGVFDPSKVDGVDLSEASGQTQSLGSPGTRFPVELGPVLQGHPVFHWTGHDRWMYRTLVNSRVTGPFRVYPHQSYVLPFGGGVCEVTDGV